jgi:hypothetical protein
MEKYIIFAVILIANLLLLSTAAMADNGNVTDLKNILEKDGFIVQEGKFGYLDVIGLYQAGFLPSCFGNNPSTPYMIYYLPPPPGEKAMSENSTEVDTLDNETLTEYRLRPDEALLFIGRTPPKCKYFSFVPYVYDRYFLDEGERRRVFASLGDPLNLMTIKTSGNSTFNASTFIITAADKGINDRIKAAGIAAGYPESIINSVVIPQPLVKMGLEQDADKFLILTRLAFFEDKVAGQDYRNGTAARVFRLTPKIISNSTQAYGVPKLRVRGTGNTSELNLTSALNDLREAILKENKGANVTELTTQVWLYEGYDALQRGIDVIGENRDTTYLRTNNFTLGDNPKEFLIVYGVNHVMTGRATYCNFGIYGADILNGVGAVSDMNFTGTADKYLPGNPAAKYLYVYKVSRNCNKSNCLFVPTGPGAYGIGPNQPAFIGFRAYLENATKTGPYWSEIVYDRVIKFS